MTDRELPGPSEESVKALEESKTRLTDARQLMAEADAVFSTLNEHIERNHFADKVRRAILGAA